MILKLTPEQAQAIFNLFNDVVLETATPSLDEQLVQLHMIAIYKKLRNKWEGETKKTYSLNLTTAEAIAYYIYWRDNDIRQYPYEWAAILSHCGQIDQELANKRRFTPPTNANKLLNQ